MTFIIGRGFAERQILKKWKWSYLLNWVEFFDKLLRKHWYWRGGSVVECRTPEREVRGSKPTAAVLCPWARHFTPRKYWLITQEAVAPSRHDWKIVDWDVKPQHKASVQILKKKVKLKRTLHIFICKKRWLRPDMTEKLLTGTLSLNTKNSEKKSCRHT